jgi:asparagine synthase (glutamine-hydrolysing)
MFRAPFDSFHLDAAPPFVDELLRPEALQKTGYFDADAVSHWRKAYRGLPTGGLRRTSVEMGLVGVLATQLWHQIFIDSTLADVPSPTGSASGEWKAGRSQANGAPYNGKPPTPHAALPASSV